MIRFERNWEMLFVQTQVFGKLSKMHLVHRDVQCPRFSKIYPSSKNSGLFFQDCIPLVSLQLWKGTHVAPLTHLSVWVDSQACPSLWSKMHPSVGIWIQIKDMDSFASTLKFLNQ